MYILTSSQLERLEGNCKLNFKVYYNYICGKKIQCHIHYEGALYFFYCHFYPEPPKTPTHQTPTFAFMKILLIGQGISGTWLSYWLQQSGAEIIIIDEERPNSATRVASGLINPLTGRRVVTTWMAETLLPFAETHYTNLGEMLNAKLISNCGIMAFPSSEEMVDAYQKRIDQGSPYVHGLTQTETWEAYFNFRHGVVHIQPAYWVDLQTLLAGWRQWLLAHGLLRQDCFDESKLQVLGDGVVYNDIHADYIVYCDGIHTFQSTYWQGLPYSFNKGEALIVSIDGLPHGQIYKFGISVLVPWHNGQWWVGSTYENDYVNELPTDAFSKRTEYFLQHTLRLPFTITDHVAAIRPSVLERRPFVGKHPHSERVGIFNGMGSKGVSLAPYFAKQLAEHVLYGSELSPDVDIRRYKRAFS